MAVRRTALRHPCAGDGCVHRNHRRDRIHAGFLSEMLGLPDDMATSEDYDSEIMWGDFTKEDAILCR